jgi:hypothetical protein
MKPTPHTYIRIICVTVLLLVAAANTFGQTPDPGAPGPLTVTREEYSFGDTAFSPTDFPGPVELTASIHYPSNLPGGPYPVVVLLHGRHATCFRSGSGLGTAFLEWPCTTVGAQPIPSYKGYDYFSQVLASHGYVVVSISANGVNAVDNSVFDLGALARAELIQKHLDILQTFNTTGGAPFGTRFVGKFDLTRVGTMGHSRGGEGVVRHYVLNNSLGAPYGIKAVFPLAPVDFSRFVVNNAPINVLLPYCDGDVADLQGVHFYDDARYNVPGDQAPKHYVLVMGANHNFYNTVWSPSSKLPSSVDDFLLFVTGGHSDSQCGDVRGNRRLTEAQQRGTGLAYMSAFFRTYVGGETQFTPILTGDAPPPPSALTNDLFVSYHAPASLRLDVNRLLNDTNLTLNNLGGAVTQLGLTPYDLCGGEDPQPRFCLPDQPGARQPHTAQSARAPAVRGLSQLRTGWNNFTGSYRNDLPGGSGNVSGFQAIQFRVSVNFTDVRNVENLAQDFRVQLTDSSGGTASVRVSNVSGALFFPPGNVGPVPKVVLNTVRVPLSAFGGVNLSNVRSVQFTFDERLAGGLLISDVAFASAPQ